MSVTAYKLLDDEEGNRVSLPFCSVRGGTEQVYIGDAFEEYVGEYLVRYKISEEELESKRNAGLVVERTMEDVNPDSIGAPDNQELTDLRQENEQLRETTASLEEDITEAELRVDDLESSIQSKRNELSEKEQEIEEAEEDIQDLQDTVKEKESELENKKEQIQELKNQVKKQKQTIEELRSSEDEE